MDFPTNIENMGLNVMIAEWDTNRLFVSNLLEKDAELFAGLRSLLKGIPIHIIPGTSDIWCRDYMPIQLDENTFCQFIYNPDYLHDYKDLVTPPDKCLLPFMKHYRKEPIVLDGGNVVASRTKVILTDKIYTENPSFERSWLRERLTELFQAECIIIPKEPYDMTGHSDGVVRFVSEDRVLINDYSVVDPGYGDKLKSLLNKKGLEVNTVPMFQEKDRLRCDFQSAVGIYINYLRVGDVIVLPGYDRPEDYIAMEKMRQIIPNAIISQVPCRSLAEQGGVLNCISWTIKDN